MTGEPPPLATSPEPGTLSALLQALACAPAPIDVAGAPPGPGQKVGRFEVVRELGRGGFGVVLEARDPLLQRDVALKLVRPGRCVDAGGPALAEAAAVAQLSHPNIVALHDAGLSDAGPFLVFEKLEGEPLSRRLERGPLPVAEAARIGVEVAKGLAHAHRNAVVHRDLKPSNVFVCSDGRVKVLDFGLAVVFGRRRMIAGGTPGWMAPEQRRGAPEDERTDVWALGAILFRSLAGRDPSGNRLTVTNEPELVALIERMLEPDPVKRPRDAAEVVDALEPIVGTIEAKKAPATVRVSRKVPRSVWRAAAALMVVAAAAVLIWRFVPGTPSPAPAGPPLVAVADFTNETGDPDLDGVGGLVGTAFQESPGLRVLTRTRMHDLMRQIGNGAAERIDESMAREIGKRAGIRGLLVGSVRRMGELVVVELRAVDPERDEYLFALREQARGKSEVLPLVDRLAARARQQLVGDRGPSSDAAPSVARLVTPNLEAYRHYATGRSLEDRSLPGAQLAYRKAIELDPDFALAHFALVSAASREKAPIGELGAIATAAIQAADRAPWREGRLIRAWNAMVERRVADARALFREVLDRHPDDKEALALYASVAVSPEEMLAYLERALLADPMYVPAQEQIVWAMRDLGRQAELIPLARTWLAQPPAPRRLAAAAYALATAGDLDGALDAAKREALLSPGRPTLEMIHLARGEYLEAERAARERIERSGKGIVQLAAALRYQGRRKEALAVLGEASRDGSSTAYAALGIAAGDGPSERLRARARELVDAQPALDWLAALALALAGDVPEAERHATALPREHADPGSGVFPDEVLSVRSFVQALAARARGDPAGRAMLRDLIASRRFKARLISAFTLGQACAEDGDLGCAVAALRQYRTEHSPLVLFQSWMFPRSTLLLAEAVERQGQVDEARGLVERLLSDWRNADPDLPDLARARALCTRLRCHPAPGPR